MKAELFVGEPVHLTISSDDQIFRKLTSLKIFGGCIVSFRGTIFPSASSSLCCCSLLCAFRPLDQCTFRCFSSQSGHRWMFAHFKCWMNRQQKCFDFAFFHLLLWQWTHGSFFLWALTSAYVQTWTKGNFRVEWWN